MFNKSRVATAKTALPGRDTPLEVPDSHYVNGNRMVAPFPAGMETAIVGMGCL